MFNKAYNLRLIMVFISAYFFINTTLYAKDLCIGAHLRPPMLNNDPKKIKERVNPVLELIISSQQIVNNTEEARRRREFFDDLNGDRRLYKRREAQKHIMRSGMPDTRPVPTTAQTVAFIQMALKHLPKGLEIILFGSFADGKQHVGTEYYPRSDLDISFTPESVILLTEKESKMTDIDRFIKSYLEENSFSFSHNPDYNSPKPLFITLPMNDYPMTEEDNINIKKTHRFFQRQKYIWLITSKSAKKIDLDQSLELPGMKSQTTLKDLINSLKPLLTWN